MLDNQSIEIVKLLEKFTNTVISAAEKNEPSFIARYLLDLSKAYSNFYNENKIIVDDKDTMKARLLITYAVNIVLKSGAGLLGMEMPDKM